MIASSQKWCSSQNLCATWLLKACRTFRFWIIFSHLISVYQKCPAICRSQKFKVENWGPLLAVALAVLCWVGSPGDGSCGFVLIFSACSNPQTYGTVITVLWNWGMQCRLWTLRIWEYEVNWWTVKWKMLLGSSRVGSGGRPIQPHQSMNNCSCGSRGKRGISCRNPSNIKCPCAYIY